MVTNTRNTRQSLKYGKRKNKLDINSPTVKGATRETGVASTILVLIIVSIDSIAVISVLGIILIVC